MARVPFLVQLQAFAFTWRAPMSLDLYLSILQAPASVA